MRTFGKKFDPAVHAFLKGERTNGPVSGRLNMNRVDASSMTYANREAAFGRKRRGVVESNAVRARPQIRREPDELAGLRAPATGAVETCVASPVGRTVAEAMPDPEVWCGVEAAVFVVYDLRLQFASGCTCTLNWPAQ